MVAMCHRVIVDVAGASTTRLQMAPDYHRAMLGDDISMQEYNWSPDSQQLALVSTPRDHKGATLRLVDVRPVLLAEPRGPRSVAFWHFHLCVCPYLWLWPELCL